MAIAQRIRIYSLTATGLLTSILVASFAASFIEPLALAILVWIGACALGVWGTLAAVVIATTMEDRYGNPIK